jgi:hypothetical protein
MMAKAFKKIGLGLVLILGIGCATVYYFWHQATKLPDWYADQSAQSLASADLPANAAKVDQKIKSETQRSRASGRTNNVEVQLSGEEINQLMVAKLAQKTGTAQLPTAIKAVNTQINGDRLKTGAVIDLAALPTSDLDPQEKAWIDEINQKFPTLANRKIYVGIEGKPQVDEGQLIFDNSMKVQLGELSFTLTELAERLEVPEAKLQEKLDLKLKVGDLNVQQIEVQGGKAVFKGMIK